MASGVLGPDALRAQRPNSGTRERLFVDQLAGDVVTSPTVTDWAKGGMDPGIIARIPAWRASVTANPQALFDAFRRRFDFLASSTQGFVT